MFSLMKIGLTPIVLVALLVACTIPVAAPQTPQDSASRIDAYLSNLTQEKKFSVLGYIIEKVSGQSYETFLQQRIFEPLGMRNSGYDDNRNHVAVGYKTIGIKAPVADLLFRYSAGGLYSSVEDLYAWDQALYGEQREQLISKEYLDMMFTGYARTPSMDIEEADYGYGWFIGKILNRPVLAHGGGMSGFCAMVLRFPNERVTIIVLRNYELQIYDRLEIELAKMVFDEK